MELIFLNTAKIVKARELLCATAILKLIKSNTCEAYETFLL